MIINRIYEHQKSSVAVACFLLGRAKDLSAPLYVIIMWRLIKQNHTHARTRTHTRTHARTHTCVAILFLAI
jgi:hypothetical protein